MIRKATVNDLPSLYKISQHSFDIGWSMASFEAELLKQFSHSFLYIKDNNIVAYLIVWVIEDEGEIAALAVDKGWRNKGIASTLLKYAFSTFNIVKKWHLEVDQNNLIAFNLYEKHSFKKIRIINDYYGNGRDAIQMKREAKC